MNIGDRGIRQLSVSVALILYAVVKYLEPNLPQWAALILPGASPASTTDAGGALQLLSAAWSGFKVGMLILVIEHLLYRIEGAQFIGRWVYVSSTGNYGIAKLWPTGFWAGGVGMAYSVSLFHTIEQVSAAMKGLPSGTPFGTADGQIVSLKDSKLTIIYSVAVGSDPYDAKRGILTISKTANRNVLTGIWESTKINTQFPDKEKEIRVGDLRFYRPNAFIAATESGSLKS